MRTYSRINEDYDFNFHETQDGKEAASSIFLNQITEAVKADAEACRGSDKIEKPPSACVRRLDLFLKMFLRQCEINPFNLAVNIYGNRKPVAAG